MHFFEVIEKSPFELTSGAVSPSLLLSLAKPGAWLLDSWEELLKDGGGRLERSALSQFSVEKNAKEKKIKHRDEELLGKKKICHSLLQLIFSLHGFEYQDIRL